MFQFISNFFRRIFGAVESQESKIKRLATAAGILVAANNPLKVCLITSLLKGIASTIDKDKDRAAANGLINQTLAGLMKDATPEEKAAIIVLFGDLDYSAATNTIDADLPVLKALIDGFLEGMTI